MIQINCFIINMFDENIIGATNKRVKIKADYD